MLEQNLRIWLRILKESNMRKIYFIFLIFSLLPVLSCTSRHHFSSRVDVEMCGSARVQPIRDGSGELVKDSSGTIKTTTTCVPPVVFYLAGEEKEKVICRRGLPDNFTAPWDAERRAQGREDAQEDGSDNTGEEARSNIITHEIGGYWLKIFPVIRNYNNYYLLITQLEFKAKLGNSEWQDVSLGGNYCETSPYLYILKPSGVSQKRRSPKERQSLDLAEGSYVDRGQFDKTFVMGNLAFYLDGLPEPEIASQANNNRFTDLRISNYLIEWRMFGNFYTAGGEQVASFQKKGQFTTQRSSF